MYYISFSIENGCDRGDESLLTEKGNRCLGVFVHLSV